MEDTNHIVFEVSKLQPKLGRSNADLWLKEKYDAEKLAADLLQYAAACEENSVFNIPVKRALVLRGLKPLVQELCMSEGIQTNRNRTVKLRMS